MVDLHSSREAGSAQGPPSATERRECKSRVTLLLRDADSGQIDHMAAEPTHGPHHPCTSSSRLGARGTLLPIGNLQLAGGSKTLLLAPVMLCYYWPPVIAKLGARPLAPGFGPSRPNGYGGMPHACAHAAVA